MCQFGVAAKKMQASGTCCTQMDGCVWSIGRVVGCRVLIDQAEISACGSEWMLLMYGVLNE